MTRSVEDFPVPLIHLAETDSTSQYLNNLCAGQHIEEFTTVAADFQTAGRGQRGNSWESVSKKNLLFSFVLYPDFLEARKQFFISQIVSLSVKEELDTIDEGFSIKWPNDIYWKGKKICGMLIENNLMDGHISQSIAGIGININQERFTSLAPNPVSLWQITGTTYDPVDVLNRIMIRMKSNYAILKQEKTGEINTRYQDSLFRKEGWHRYNDANGEFTARILRTEPDGTLILQKTDGKEYPYLFKEVQYLL